MKRPSGCSSTASPKSPRTTRPGGLPIGEPGNRALDDRAAAAARDRAGAAEAATAAGLAKLAAGVRLRRNSADQRRGAEVAEPDVFERLARLAQKTSSCGPSSTRSPTTGVCIIIPGEESVRSENRSSAMKTVVSINQKIGQPNYGSFGARPVSKWTWTRRCWGLTRSRVLSHCRLLGDLARAAVERELDLQRTTRAEASSGEEPGDDDDEPPDEMARTPAPPPIIGSRSGKRNIARRCVGADTGADPSAGNRRPTARTIGNGMSRSSGLRARAAG